MFDCSAPNCFAPWSKQYSVTTNPKYSNPRSLETYAYDFFARNSTSDYFCITAKTNLQKDYINGISKNEEKKLQIRDANAQNWPNELWLQMLNLGDLCTSKRKKDRPLMTRVWIFLFLSVSTDRGRFADLQILNHHSQRRCYI